MAISIEGWPAELGGRQRPRSADMRGSWLFELEQALLSQAGKKPPAPQRPATPEAVDAAFDARRPAAREDQHDGAPSLSDAAQAAAALVPQRQTLDSVPVERGDGASTARADVGMASAGAVPAGAAATNIATATAAATSVDMTIASDSAAVAEASVTAAASPMWRGGVAHSVFAERVGAAYAPVAATGQAQALGGEPASVEPGVQPPSAKAVVSGATLLAANLGSLESPQEDVGDGPHEAAQTPGDELQAAEREEYARRLLHVYRDADGVQAWIRDAGIGLAQARQLAQAMASELAGAGAPLSALTLNGKRLPLSAPGSASDNADDAHDAYDADGMTPPVAPRTINPYGAA